MIQSAKKISIQLTFIWCLSLLLTYQVNAAPNIIVSIKPIHSIASQITQGITEPVMLFPEGASPHTFALKPSHRTAIAKADLLVWVGEDCETHLQRVLQQYPKKTLTLMQVPALHRLPIRTQREFNILADHNSHDDHDHHHAQDHHKHEHAHQTDAHIWLSIENAKVITQAIAERLAQLDPDNSAAYLKNAKHYLNELTQLKSALETILKDKQPAPFLVFHDAYQYFEHEFGVNSAGTVLLNPHVPLTPRSLNHIKSIIEQNRVACIFYEPEFNHQPIKNNFQDSGIRLLELDPLGVRQPKGKDSYAMLMQALAAQIGLCQSIVSP